MLKTIKYRPNDAVIMDIMLIKKTALIVSECEEERVKCNLVKCLHKMTRYLSPCNTQTKYFEKSICVYVDTMTESNRNKRLSVASDE